MSSEAYYSIQVPNKNPSDRHSEGFSIPFFYGGLFHRLVTDYLSPSSHLLMQ